MRPRHHILATEIEDAFRHCLTSIPSVDDSVNHLIAIGILEKLKEFIAENSKVADAVHSGGAQLAPINDPTFVHFIWLLKLGREFEDLYLQILGDEKIEKKFPQTAFWRYYTTAIHAYLGSPKSNEVKKPKLKGYEKLWEPYTDYMLGLVEIEEFHTTSAQSFKTRNKQKKMTDWKSLDGDSNRQTLWDLRAESIIRRAQQVVI